MARITGKRPSAERVQDWISSVLNPVIEGVRREDRLLEMKSFHWLPTRHAFEYLHPVGAFVAEIYRDNYEDFLLKNPELQPLIRRHDEALEDLERAVSLVYEKLMGPKASRLKASAHLGEDARWKYFAAHVAANLKDMPSEEELAQEYQRLLPKAVGIVHDEKQAAESKAKTLRARVAAFLNACVELRTDLADEYGARIIPVEY